MTEILVEPTVPGRAIRNLCDDCYKRVTGLLAECQDFCSLRLDHAGLCAERNEVDQPCHRCGEMGHRLTAHEPQDEDEEAASRPGILARIAYLGCVAAGCSTVHGDGNCDDADCPLCSDERAAELARLREQAEVTIQVTYWVPTQYSVEVLAVQAAAKLHRRGRDEAAAIAEKVASGEITSGDATSEVGDPAAPHGMDLHELAYAMAKEADAFDMAGPNGDAVDWDDAETYHVYITAEIPDDRTPAAAVSADRHTPGPASTRDEVTASFDKAIAEVEGIAGKDPVLHLIARLAAGQPSGIGPFTRDQANAAWNAAADAAKRYYNPAGGETSHTIRSDSVGDLIINLAGGFLGDPAAQPAEVIAQAWHDLDVYLDEFQVWNKHSNDLGDGCPWSGQRATQENREALCTGLDPDDERCPQGCRGSYLTDPERGTDVHKAAIVATVKGWVS